MKPFVPEQAWPVLQTLRSFTGDGPIVGTPSFGRVLALAAHPDDEVVGCGGLLALLADGGAEVHVCFATDGDATTGVPAGPEEISRLRRGEAEASCRVLGARPPRFLHHPDGRLSEHAAELAREVASLVDELRPDVVIAPWELDGHDDHRAVAASVPDGVEFWGYETWTPLTANRIVDISPVFERVRQALACHETAHLAFDVEAMLSLDRYRSVHGLSGRGYAEAYLVRPAT
jgi:LmbE family N-acetylglucosaminyl deacetylase